MASTIVCCVFGSTDNWMVWLVVEGPPPPLTLTTVPPMLPLLLPTPPTTLMADCEVDGMDESSGSFLTETVRITLPPEPDAIAAVDAVVVVDVVPEVLALPPASGING